MRGHLFVHGLLLAGAVLGCGGEAGGSALEDTLGAVHVDAAAGDDASGDGSRAHPFRTLTRGLAAVHPRGTVQLGAGRYAAGERFPIIVPPRSTVQGEAGCALEGAGPYWSPSLGATVAVAVVASAGSRIGELRIRAPGGAAVWSEDPGSPAELLSDELVDSDFGAVFAGTVEALIGWTSVAGNARVGLEVRGDARPVLRNVDVTSNAVGVAIRDRAQPDLGTAGSPGGNRFSGNTDCDVANLSSSVIEARGDTWDANPYLIAAGPDCAAGADLVTPAGAGAVLVQDVPPAAGPIFPGATAIGGLGPAAGSLLPTGNSSFNWDPTGRSLVVVGVFTEPIAVNAGHITNAGAMVWAWHTGLGTGREGAVSFANGVTPLGASLLHVVPPTPLQRGRTYYWAVWAWEEGGGRIAAASPLMFFTVLD